RVPGVDRSAGGAWPGPDRRLRPEPHGRRLRRKPRLGGCARKRPSVGTSELLRHRLAAPERNVGSQATPANLTGTIRASFGTGLFHAALRRPAASTESGRSSPPLTTSIHRLGAVARRRLVGGRGCAGAPVAPARTCARLLRSRRCRLRKLEQP